MAVVFIKLSTLHPVLLAGYRLLAAAFCLLPWFIRDLRRSGHPLAPQIITAVLPGFFLSLHFITWNIGARMTPAANATLLVNLSPVVTPFLLYFIASEKTTLREAAGTVLALLGAVILSRHDLTVSRENFQGDLVCAGSALLYALYFSLGRRNRKHGTILLYLVPLYFAAGVFCMAAAVPVANMLEPITLRDAACIAALALLPTLIGHSLINNSLRYLRGQIVSILCQTQIIFGGIVAYFIFAEVPPRALYPAALLVIAGAALAITRIQPENEAAGVADLAGE